MPEFDDDDDRHHDSIHALEWRRSVEKRLRDLEVAEAEDRAMLGLMRWLLGGLCLFAIALIPVIAVLFSRR